MPLNTVSVRGVASSEIGAVEVGRVTFIVPPRTFERHCTRVWPNVVVLVPSAELLSDVAG